MRIALIGFMGSGKTTVGRKLASLLDFSFLDLDEEIERELKMSIPDIFDRYGEGFFRSVEKSICMKLLSKYDNLILSTGGGLPSYNDNMGMLNQKAITVYLKQDFDVLWNRISSDRNRPLVRLGREKVESLLEERKPFYGRAFLTVFGNSKSPDEIAKEIAWIMGLSPEL
jgi:shikimate kinase